MLLNCHTYYSFCYGTYSIEALLDSMSLHGYTTFAITDINNTSACLDVIRICNEKSLKPVVGIDFRNGAEACYIGIARNNDGFVELNKHLSEHLHSEKAFDKIAPEFNHAYIIYPLHAYEGQVLREHEFIGVSMAELTQLPLLPIAKLTHKLVVLHTISFANKQHFNAHRILRAIDTNLLLSKLPASEQGSSSQCMLSKTALMRAYADYPFMIKNTERLLNDCHIEFAYGKLANKNLRYYTGSAAGDASLLRDECMRNLMYRYPQPTIPIMERIQKEIDVISQLNFASYFLINWDIVNYARHKNYYYVGRGSGANSIVAYLLRITDVDPIELDLYFERFINLYRNNAPDFDMDFSWTDRDDITRYIFERFGYERTALLGSYNTFQHDAVIRETGKVFGLPPGDIERLQRTDANAVKDDIETLVLRYSNLIQGFPNHLSIHSSGILISEKPIHTYSATFMPPKGYPTTQFSMLEAEDIGLFKFDILSQRGLGKIKDTLHIVQKNKGEIIDIHNTALFKKDERVKELLRVGKTIGCFYIESPAMRMLLSKLRADDYLRLVAASSIIRPGVSKSGMMREYIVRYRDETLRTKARDQLPELYDLLEETYGVMVYQEDVIKVAHFFAGLTLAESDYLRRGMSWKFKQRNEFGRVKDNFFANCKAKGYAQHLVQDIWTQIESFANYAFSKGHSASYAVESYQALYLKAYHPLEYMVATLNNGGGFYNRELYVHEARMQGATIKPPCVNHSHAHAVIKGKTIYLGLGMIAELEQETIQRILQERNAHGVFADLLEFMKRVSLSVEQMRLLIRAKCFQFSGANTKELLWEMHAILRPLSKRKQQEELFVTHHPKWKLPVFEESASEDAFEEIALFGFPLSSPFHLLKEEHPSTMLANQLVHYICKEVCILGYRVSTKPTYTSKGERMSFGTFIDREGYWIDTVHFPPSIAQYPFTGPGVYELRGIVMEEYDHLCIDIHYMKRLPNKDRE